MKNIFERMTRSLTGQDKLDTAAQNLRAERQNSIEKAKKDAIVNAVGQLKFAADPDSGLITSARSRVAASQIHNQAEYLVNMRAFARIEDALAFIQADPEVIALKAKILELVRKESDEHNSVDLLK